MDCHLHKFSEVHQLKEDHLLESRAAAVGVWTEMAVVEMICISTATVTETSVGAEGTKD